MKLDTGIPEYIMSYRAYYCNGGAKIYLVEKRRDAVSPPRPMRAPLQNCIMHTHNIYFTLKRG